MKKRLILAMLAMMSRMVFSIGVKTLDTTLVGTDKTQLIETKWTFTSGDDYAKGYVTFCRGIELMSSGSTYTVDLGITGVCHDEITLNGNTLRLTKDLNLGDFVIVNGPGFIDLNGSRLKVGDQLQFRLDKVTAYGFLGGGVIEGQDNSIMQFFMGGGLYYHSLLIGGIIPSITMRNMIVLDARNTTFITSDDVTSLLQNVEFVVSEGVTFDLRGEHDTIERGFLRFTGMGSTIMRHDHGSNWFGQLTGVARLEINKGVTYITDETFIITDDTALGTSDQTRIILDNAAFVVDGVDLTMDQVSFEALGRSSLGSLNGGTLQLFDGANLRVFPGATLEVDNGLLLKLGAP